MKILMIDKFYFIKGGAERYLFELSELLQREGHEVIPFSMKHPQNFKTLYQDYFVENMDYDLKTTYQKIIHSVHIAGRMIYSLQAQRRLEKLIRMTRPDIAHIHMIDHQISPSILHVLKRHRIPVIQTVHQYKLICPNYRLYNEQTQTVCAKCINRRFYHPIIERCHKDSRIAGLLLAIEMTVHQLLRIYDAGIDLFHVPSRFMGEMLEKGHIPPEKIFPLFYTIDMEKFHPTNVVKDYFVYYGRLSKEKGIHTLLKAMEQIPRGKLCIIGDGPERESLEEFVVENELQNVEFLGYHFGDDLYRLIAESQFVVVPSEWYDNSPLVIYEAFALGKPVIGSRIGGIPELVKHLVTGLLFEMHDHEMLEKHIQYLLDNRDVLKRLGKNARKMAEESFTPSMHVRKMLQIYDKLIQNKKSVF